MALPTPDAYNDAVQTPRLAFSDTELANATVVCNGFGIPNALGGGFAITYRLSSQGGKSYAVRCFHKEVRNLQDRYHRIHSALNTTKSPLFVGFEYQPTGINVKSARYPIVKMEWATGLTLGEYIEQNYQNNSAIVKLRGSFAMMEAELQLLGIAHGDLQNGNVLVCPQGKVRLVDYDGMFVPGMNTGSGAELGHKNFQHPHRNASSFGPSLDQFSFLVIDLSLWAITLNPDLFPIFSTGENILFAANDFADPASSKVFHALKKVADGQFQTSLDRFAEICQSPFSSIPRLADFLSGRSILTAQAAPQTASPAPQKYIGAFPVIDASNFGVVCQHVGDKVELVGQVFEVKDGRTRKGAPYVFINFGSWRDDCVRITIWSDGLQALGVSPDSGWHGQWIVVNGLIDPVYHGKNRFNTITYRSVGITVSDRSQIHKITPEEALWRLGRGDRTGIPTADTPAPALSKNDVILREIFSKPTSPNTATGHSSSKPRPPYSNKPYRHNYRPPRYRPPQQPQQAPQAPIQAPHTEPISIKDRNEAILKGLIPSGARHENTVSSPGNSIQSTKPPTNDHSGCLIMLGIIAFLFLCWIFWG
jgi:hypothetical protein